jgi:hypothetical protein
VDPVPFPTEGEVDHRQPGQEEACLIAAAFATAVAPEGGLTRLQQVVLAGLTDSMLAEPLDLGDVTQLPPVTPRELAEALARRDRRFRIRRIQNMITLELMLRPLPREVADRVEQYADALGVGTDCRDLVAGTQHLSIGSLGLAVADFQRNGYEMLGFEREHDLDPHTVGEYWIATTDDPELAGRWRALEHSPKGSLGRKVWEFYTARGFAFPGMPGSAPVRLAQHDWVHVLADYGTTVEGEIEVYGLIARADEEPRAFSLLVEVLGLFETGFLQRGLGVFEMNMSHMSSDEERMGVRFSDAIRRGGEIAWKNGEKGIDLMGIDWFQHANQPLEEVRAHFHFDAKAVKSEAAKAAGSAGPFERGGITTSQRGWGVDLAEDQGRPYDPFGAEPLP